MRRSALALAACLAFSVLSIAGAAPALADARCAVPDALTAVSDPLPRLAARLRGSEPVRVVVIGTGSTAGMGMPRPELAYPQQLATQLGKRFPKSTIELKTIAERGQPAQQQLVALRAALRAKPALVIWQTGTVDAVQGVEPAAFGEQLTTGIDLVRGSGADVALIDMLFSPRSTALTNFKPYLEYMQQIASVQDVVLFDRYQMMDYWHAEQRIDLNAENKDEQGRVTEFVHGCLAELMAGMIQEGVRLAEPTR